MNQKQLANVLIKVLGLSLCVQSFTHLITAATSLLSMLTQSPSLVGRSLYYWLSPLNGIALGLLGLMFIVLSQAITDLLLRDE